MAKKTASEKNVDLSGIEGSGPNGRVLKHNVEEQAQKGGKKTETEAKPAEVKPAEKKPAAGKEAGAAKPQAPKVQQGENPYEDIPLTSIREIIAKRLLQSKTTVPHFYLETEILMDEAIK